jgi:hypothetical protein
LFFNICQNVYQTNSYGNFGRIEKSVSLNKLNFHNKKTNFIIRSLEVKDQNYFIRENTILKNLKEFLNNYFLNTYLEIISF